MANSNADTIIGTPDDDTLDGISGIHTLSGGMGDDIYYVHDPNDVIIENLDEGNDTICSYVSYTLPDNTENLILLGSDNINGTGNNSGDYITGNSGNNVLTGGIGNDTIDGGPGADTMIGGRGSDTYYVDSPDDVIVENPGGGTETVNSSVTYHLPDNAERLLLFLLGDKDGYGNNLDNYINGNCFANYLYGDAGSDTIYGSLGNDTIDGGTGADKMFGGTGNDVFYVDDTSDIVTEYLNDGMDEVRTAISYTLPNNVENLTLLEGYNINGTGNYLDNYMTGNSNDNILRSFAGNDTVDGGIGADTMIGSIGNDVYYVDNTGDIVTENSDEGNDTVISSTSYSLQANTENLTLSGSDNINATGNELDNYIIGNIGDNILSGNTGNDTLDGSSGNDILSGGSGNDTFIFNKGYGNDIIQDSEKGDSLKFGDKIVLNDLTIYKDGNDLNIGVKTSLDTLIIQNWFSSDQNKMGNIIFQDGTILTPQNIENIMLHQHGLPLNGNADSMAGTSDSDIFFVDNPGDIVKENSNGGNDEVRSIINYSLPANVENLTLTGSSDINGTGNSLNNYIIGNIGNNILTGGLGNDTIDGNFGIDTMMGGKGNDVYYVENSGDVITEYSGQGTDMVYTSVSYELSDNIEKLDLLGTDNIDGYGNNMANIIWGNNGNNCISGIAGNDTLYGYGGNDSIDGGTGSDSMYGGLGDDIYRIDSSTDRIIEYANQGTDTVNSTISYTLGSNIENLTLFGTDNLTGTGNGLNNVVTGNSGNNKLYGGAGNDTLIGGDGNDTLDGSSGCDSLIGGTGNDMLKGGGNEDIYAGYDARGFGSDTIYDTSGTEDRLELGSYDSSIPTFKAVDTDHNGRVDGLIIDFGSNDSIFISNYFSNTKVDPHLSSVGYGLLETIHFSNGDYHFQDIQGLIH